MRNVVRWGVVALLVVFAGCAGRRHETPKVDTGGDLLAWSVVGIGGVVKAGEGGGYRLTEGANSKGVTFVSRKAYGRDVTVSFAIRPERREGVCVVFLSASDGTGKLTPPAVNDGSLGFWSEGTGSNYMIAFHTAFHQPNLFINRNPGMTTLARVLDPAGGEKWYAIEISRRGGTVRVKVDGATVLEGVDTTPDGLPGGHVGIRLRGPGDGSYSCFVKDVVITEG